MDGLASRQYPVQEHMAFQRRMWIVQRIGWVMLGVISLAALFGLFGYDVLSKRTATGAEMSVEYERFERAIRRASFVFRFAASANTERRLHLNQAFQEGFEISSIQPPRCGAPWMWNGSPMRYRMRRARVTEDNILEAARRLHGLERMDQIKFAILEPTGKITIVPKS